jgi:hypothetical protein
MTEGSLNFPDDIELPYPVSPHPPALFPMSMSNVLSDAVLRVELLLRAKLLLYPIV